MDITKLTSKYQTTIPQSVREFLGLGKGDAVRFAIHGNRVLIEKATAVDWEFAKFSEGTLSEWHSAEDDAAFTDI